MYVFLFFKINFGVCRSGFIINAYNKTVSFETVQKRENKKNSSQIYDLKTPGLSE